MEPHSPGISSLFPLLVLLGAMVATAPLVRRLGLSAIVGYIAAGIAVGPWGFAIFREPATILGVAELGVVMLLFLIGLELRLSRLFAMRRDIFGYGAAQLVLTAVALGALAIAIFGFDWRGGVVVGLALAMSSTAIVLQLLEERGDLHAEYGQRAFAVLLFQDMAVVPLLALLPLIAPFRMTDGGGFGTAATVTLIGAGAIAVIVLAGRYLLNPFFRILASTGAREAMTAGALLIVLGAALTMQLAGMSMALGAFLAGLLLAESNYRHELEAEIEPFRGLLLAFFFMGVGMSIDLTVVRENLVVLLVGAFVVMAVKAAVVGALFRPTCHESRDAFRAGAVLGLAGEFAFVLLPAGLIAGILTQAQVSVVAALAALTMLFGPPLAALSERLLASYSTKPERAADDFSEARGSVLIVGFGRFGQVVSQCFLAQGIDVTIIDHDVEMIQSASRFGFKIYYGDGTRLDVLRAAGAGRARLVAVCVDQAETTTRIAELIKSQFPGAKLFVRSFDRRHTLELVARGVDFELRETFESAIRFGGEALKAIGIDAATAVTVMEDVRSRDRERLALQEGGGMYAGLDVLHRPRLEPTPLTSPRRAARPLNPDAEEVITHESEFSG
jgi:monovalent cation:proton antiporter-2 (CPA2) family protein